MRYKKKFRMFIVLVIPFFISTVGIAQELWIQTNGPNGGVVSSLVVDSEGRIYAGTLHGGLYISSNQGKTWERINHGISSLEIRAISLTPDGNIFVGTGKGLVFVSPNRGKDWNLSTSLPSEVHTMMVDRKGRLFVGSGGHGVFTLISEDKEWKQNSLSYSSVQCFTIGSSDEMYAATNNGMFRSMDEGDTWHKIDIPNIYIFSLVSDFNGRLFAGTWGGKLYRSDNKGKSWVSFDLGTQDSIIRTMCIDKAGNIIVGACKGGLFQSKDGGATWKSVNNGLNDVSVRSIAVGFKGDVFVGTTNGLVFRSSETNVSSSPKGVHPIFGLFQHPESR